MSTVCCLLAGTLITTNGLAEEYDFELDLSLGRSNFEGSRTFETSGGTIFNSGDTDTDEFSVLGTWYFNGLTDDVGPRARAALTSRASSLTLGVARFDQTDRFVIINTDPNLPIPDLNSGSDSDGELLAANFRYVDRDSGWFGSIGVQTSNLDTFGFVNESLDTTEWRLSVGRYIFENTTLTFGAGEIDFDFGSDATVYEVAVEHLGDLGGGWQYAIDLGFDRTDGSIVDLDALTAAVSLYPTRDFEFGIAVSDISNEGGLGLVDSSYEGFASWFVTPNVSLSASYRVDDVDFFGNVFIGGGAPTESNADSDSFGISATWRFD